METQPLTNTVQSTPSEKENHNAQYGATTTDHPPSPTSQSSTPIFDTQDDPPPQYTQLNQAQILANHTCKKCKEPFYADVSTRANRRNVTCPFCGASFSQRKSFLRTYLGHKNKVMPYTFMISGIGFLVTAVVVLTNGTNAAAGYWIACLVVGLLCIGGGALILYLRSRK